MPIEVSTINGVDAAFQRADSRTLAELVRAHTPFDDDERAHCARTLEWLRRASHPLDRSCFDPGHAVGSAFVLSTDGLGVALMHHARLNRWLQPGGHAESHEHELVGIAAREATEELGIHLAREALELFDLDVQSIPAGRSAPEHLHFDFRFVGAVPRQPLLAATDATDARWFSVSQLRALGTDRGLVRMLDKSIARGLLRA